MSDVLKKYGRYVVIAVAVCALLVIPIGVGYRNVSEVDREVSKSMRVAEVVRHDMQEEIGVEGRVVPAHLTHLSFQGEGVVQEVKVRVGDEVKRGDILASQDARAAHAVWQEARAQHAEEVQKLNELIMTTKNPALLIQLQVLARAQDLLAHNQIGEEGYTQMVAGAQSQIDALLKKVGQERISVQHTKVQAAEARMMAARAVFEGTALRAPIDGVVVARDVQIGEAVSGLQTVVTIASRHELWVEVFVSADEVVKIKKGQEVMMSITAHPETSIKGSVIEVAPLEVMTGDEEARYRIVMALGAQREGWISGVVVHGMIMVDRVQVLAIEASAITSDRTGDYVEMREGDIVKKVRITRGQERDGMVEVTSGLNEGDEVVIE